MVLRAKQFIFLLSYTFCVKTFSAASSESDDDNLKEALFLVDILKSEYVKVLRENDGAEQSRVASDEQSTCGSTTESDQIITISQQVETARPYQQSDGNLFLHRSLPQAPVDPQARLKFRRTHNLYQPFKKFRRRRPREFYYYYDTQPEDENGPYYRRFGDDPFGPHPPDSNTTTETPTGITQTPSSLVPASDSTSKNPPNSDITTSKPVGSTGHSPLPGSPTSVSLLACTTATYSSTKLKKQTHKTATAKHVTKILKLKATATGSNDPVPGQVAAELHNEIKQIDEAQTKSYKKQRGSSKKQKLKHVLPLKAKNNPKEKDALVRTSLKIYLERSTRYPIPYPENHAFCFTNPNNALCRTMI